MKIIKRNHNEEYQYSPYLNNKDHCECIYMDKMYVFTTFPSSPQEKHIVDFWEFDILNDSWKKLENCLTQVDALGIQLECLQKGNFIYLLILIETHNHNYEYYSEILRYSLESDEWERLNSKEWCHIWCCGITFQSHGDYLIVRGCAEKTNELTNIYLYNIVTERWSKLRHHEMLNDDIMSVVYKEKFYVFSRDKSVQSLPDFIEYDFLKDSWRECYYNAGNPEMGWLNGSYQYTLVRDSIFVTGSEIYNEYSIMEFNFLENRWYAHDLNFYIFDHEMHSYFDSIIFIGGGIKQKGETDDFDFSTIIMVDVGTTRRTLFNFINPSLQNFFSFSDLIINTSTSDEEPKDFPDEELDSNERKAENTNTEILDPETDLTINDSDEGLLEDPEIFFDEELDLNKRKAENTISELLDPDNSIAGRLKKRKMEEKTRDYKIFF